jgi:salicylate hydroxylase
MSQTKAESALRIAIIGGGIGGTALALALSTYKNIECTIYESRPEFGEIGAGLAFAPNAHRIMELMSPALWEGYKSRASFEGYKPVVNSGNSGWEETGGLWADVTVGEGAHAGKRVIAVTMDDPMTLSTAHRADFMEEIVKLLPEGLVEFNKILVEVQQGHDNVVCKFSDGGVVETDAVIGCDGIRSICRKFVFEEEANLAAPVFSKMVAYRGLVPMKLAEDVMGTEKAHNRNIIIGHDRHVITFPVSDGSLVNAVALSTKKSWEGNWVVTGQKDNMMQEFSGWDESVKKILEVGNIIIVKGNNLIFLSWLRTQVFGPCSITLQSRPSTKMASVF